MVPDASDSAVPPRASATSRPPPGRPAGQGGRAVLDGPMADSTDLTEPVVDPPEGPAPTELRSTDITVGEGPEAVPGAKVQVHYVGVEYDSGEEFDSSWGRGEPIEFPLRGLIQGWQEGIPGMRVGGRRRLEIPPQLAYGPAGSGHPLGGKTLVFVIDLLDVG